MLKKFVLSVLSVGALIPAAHAQEGSVPALPKPIENLVSEGAQIRYLGNEHGLDAWLTIKNGVEQYFYVLPDKSAFVMGVLFDDAGKMVTVRQVERLRTSGDTLLDNLAEFTPDAPESVTDDKYALKSPAEKMFSDIEGSNWVPLGQPNAPRVYAFIDPQCPHCHSFINDVLAAKALEKGQMQIRMVPVGRKEETKAQAAFLIATPNPQERWMKHMAGDETALPARSDINQQGVERNLAIMHAWKFDATPMVVYRGKDGSVKIIRGKPKDLKALLADLG